MFASNLLGVFRNFELTLAKLRGPVLINATGHLSRWNDAPVT
jgi:hypothetical protein